MFETVREQKGPGLIVFVTAGFPDMEATLELVPALVAAGADAVEIGVPFSDPLAEGPVIQESSFKALQNGTSLEDCLNVAETLREKIPETPVILMGYYNPIHTYGLVPFTQRCQEAGVDGLIAVDLPGLEAAPLIKECRERDISMIPLLAPTST
ncbi:MAG: tryptophan synthase subunit alpha, partial [Chloroflexota bacterium]|nr:tryptophan synthase subunit alpha [Chloroflexota bacterium]